MPTYRLTTPTLVKFENAFQTNDLDEVGNLLKNAGFEGCSVWRWSAWPERHWHLIFDTSAPSESRLPGAEFWANVARSERNRR